VIVIRTKAGKGTGDQVMGEKIVCRNKKAFHDYSIESTLEAGMVLSGPEVKSLRAGKANLRDGYAQINERGEAMLINVHISFYTFATHNPNEPLRSRKLLLHKREISKLIGKLREKGLALIPLKIYFNERGKAKVELGLARGKREYDKRAALKEKQSDREIQRVMRHNVV
jgi:SsrA-binding protein